MTHPQTRPEKRRIASHWPTLWVCGLLLLSMLHCGPPTPTQELIILDGSSADHHTSDAIHEAQPADQRALPEPPSADDKPAPERHQPDLTTPDTAADDQTEVDHALQDNPGTPDVQRPDLASESTPSEPAPPDQQPVQDRLPPADRASVDRVQPDAIDTPCQVNGIAGTCKRVQDCTGDQQATPGHCPGPAGIQCCTPKPPPSSGCDPNARPQPNAGLQEAAGIGGCKAGMLRVDTFCIDQYEAALLEVLPNGSTRPWSPFFNPGSTKVRAVSIMGAVPQGYISGDQASKACQEAGKRLCTDTEWLRACQSTSKYTYPYGNTRQPGVCNDARSLHPAVEYFMSSASWVFSKIQHQCINQIPKSLAKTGSYSGCVTTEKVHDMMGNLHEWTATSSGIFRGGYYVDTYRNGNGCLYRTTAHNTQHWDYSTGFRCCATP